VARPRDTRSVRDEFSQIRTTMTDAQAIRDVVNAIRTSAPVAGQAV
jgi:hypothetical protein